MLRGFADAFGGCGTELGEKDPMNRDNSRLLRHLATTVAVAVLWWAFVRDGAVDAGSGQTAAHMGCSPSNAPACAANPSLPVPRIHLRWFMVGGTEYPLMMANALGWADRGLATLLFWAKSAGFVCGVGFIPRTRIWRGIFSGWACAAALAGVAGARWVARQSNHVQTLARWSQWRNGLSAG